MLCAGLLLGGIHRGDPVDAHGHSGARICDVDDEHGIGPVGEAVDGRLSRSESLVATLQGRALALAGFGALFGGAVGALIVKMTQP